MAQLVKSDPEIDNAVKLLTTIKGIGELTAVTILAETDGFALIRCRNQLASYIGLDVKEKLSGTSVKGKPHISKRGNKYLRKAMFHPAMSAVKYDEKFKAIYERITERSGKKMKALVAVQRRLLELTYILFKNQEPYNPDYIKHREMQQA